jgi:hypothetical protein
LLLKPSGICKALEDAYSTIRCVDFDPLGPSGGVMLAMSLNDPDFRHISNGKYIPSITYSDQPYMVKAGDGAWVCVLTTGAGKEGDGGQHIIAQRSLDHGKTWIDRVAIEPPEGPEASWAVLAMSPHGRIFCFYTYNADNIRRIKTVDPAFVQGSPTSHGHYPDGYCHRVDSLGAYVFRYSDDHGRHWSNSRYVIPVREFEIDRQNVTGGKTRFFWNVGKPITSQGCLFLPIHKVGNFGYGFFVRSEGALLCSENLLALQDPGLASWVTLPEGQEGLRAPDGAGPVAEEQSFTELSDGTFLSVYRTISGYPAVSCSRDRGKTWNQPDFLRHADGRPLKNPRAANFIWRCENGKYLYWFHNNGGPKIQERHTVNASYPYEARNPVWMCGGVEYDTPEGKRISLSEPEIILYDDDPVVRMSYPDLLEDGGKYFITETNKNLGRVHELNGRQLEELWIQASGGIVPAPAPVFELIGVDGGTLDLPKTNVAPDFPVFLARDNERPDYGGKNLRSGFSLEMELNLDRLDDCQNLLDNRDRYGCGLFVHTSTEGTIEIEISDGQTRISWDTDPGSINTGKRQHLVIVIDGGPHVVSFILDGHFLDGGKDRQFGWGRFSPHFMNATGCGEIRVGHRIFGSMSLVRVYDRALTTSQAVGLYRVRRILEFHD